ncbi:flagellar assembly protein FliW [Bacillus coreaensis]
MQLQTKYHGLIEITEEQVLTFEHGIPGFIDEEKFIILPLEQDETFMILQSVSTAGLAFVLINPFHYFPDYDFSLDDNAIYQLKLSSPDDIIVYTILTIHDPFENTTANLQAPVIINSKNKLGKQVILNDTKYTSRHKIIEKG